MADAEWDSDWPDEAEWEEIPHPSAHGAGRTVDRAASGRRRARRAAQGLDLAGARAAQEHAAQEAAFEARYASRHEGVGDDGAARDAELAEWERVTALLLAQDDALPYDADRDPHVRAELAAAADALAARAYSAAGRLCGPEPGRTGGINPLLMRVHHRTDRVPPISSAEPF